MRHLTIASLLAFAVMSLGCKGWEVIATGDGFTVSGPIDGDGSTLKIDWTAPPPETRAVSRDADAPSRNAVILQRAQHALSTAVPVPTP